MNRDELLETFSKEWKEWSTMFIGKPMDTILKTRGEQSLVALIFSVFNNLEVDSGNLADDLKFDLLEAIEINYNYEKRSMSFFNTEKLNELTKDLNTIYTFRID